MRYHLIPADFGTKNPIKSRIKTDSEEIWAELKMLTLKYSKDLVYNRRKA